MTEYIEYAIEMELATGGSLEDKIGKIESVYELEKLITDCMNGINKLQNNDIKHYDIKPSNILLIKAHKNDEENKENDRLFEPTTNKISDFGGGIIKFKSNAVNTVLNVSNHAQKSCIGDIIRTPLY